MTDHDSPTASGGRANRGPVPAQFSINNAQYSIAPNSTTSDIGTDIGCALESLEELLHTAAERAADDSKTSLLVYAAINLVQQVQGLTSEYITRATRSAEMPMRQGVASVEPAGMPSATSVDEMAASLSDADCANNAVRQALDAIQDAVYSDLGAVEQGLYEAAIASTERLGRAVANGLEAVGAQSPVSRGSVQ